MFGNCSVSPCLGRCQIQRRVMAVTEKSDALTHSSIRGHNFFGMIVIQLSRTAAEVICAESR